MIEQNELNELMQAYNFHEQNEFNDLMQAFNFSKQKADLLESRLQKWNLSVKRTSFVVWKKSWVFVIF